MKHDLFATVRSIVLRAVVAQVPDLPVDLAARIEVSPTRDPSHGDMATNTAMVVAKHARQPPAKLAAGLVKTLGNDPAVVEAVSAGPGFVNLRLDPSAFRALLPDILRSGTAYG